VEDSLHGLSLVTGALLLVRVPVVYHLISGALLVVRDSVAWSFPFPEPGQEMFF